MNTGYIGKVLIADLTNGIFTVEEHDDKFWRMYLGGSALGVYYALREIPKGADPLGPDNVLTLAGSVITGAPAPGLSRFSANAKSPLTGTIGDAQGGGYFAPELKYAGFEAIVIKGRAKKPVYIWIHDDEYEIRDAGSLWGKSVGDAAEMIKSELGDERIRVAGIGLGGENLVRYACIVSDNKHTAGRTGMGAVMGSKNLKAIAVRGTKYKDLKYHDPEALKEISQSAPEYMKISGNAEFTAEQGTIGLVVPVRDQGWLPTRNFAEGDFEEAEKLSVDTMSAPPYTLKKGRCYICPLACKREVSFKDDKHGIEIDGKYGAPEYETMAMLGPNLLISDMAVACKAHDLCNEHSLDSISLGASIAFAMECRENNILKDEQCDGLDIRFGNAEVLIPLIERIINREGFIGDLLADGPRIAAGKLGNGAEKYSMDVKGNPLPAHMPQFKRGLGVHYAVNCYGADHASSDQDPAYSPDTPEVYLNRMRGYGLYNPVEVSDIGAEKMRMIHITQQVFGIINSLGFCLFVYATAFLFGLPEMIKVVNGVTGWDVTGFELMRAGERYLNMMRLFNQREGFTRKDDCLPERIHVPLGRGPLEGWHIPKDEFESALDDYYEIAGWDIETGNPTDRKIKELDLTWAE